MRQGKVAEAFEIADAARGRARWIDLAAARRDIERAPRSAAELLEGDRILREIDALADELRALDSVPPRDRGAPQEATARFLATRLAEVRQRYEDRLAVATASSAPSLLGPPASAAAVMAALRPGEAILEYLVSPSGVHVFVLRPAAVTHALNPVNREELSSRVRLARRAHRAPRGRCSVRARPRGAVPGPAGAGRGEGSTGRSRTAADRSARSARLPSVRRADRRYRRVYADALRDRGAPSAASLPALRGSESPGGSPTGVGGLALAPMPDALPATREEASSVRRASAGEPCTGEARRSGPRGRDWVRARGPHRGARLPELRESNVFRHRAGTGRKRGLGRRRPPGSARAARPAHRLGAGVPRQAVRPAAAVRGPRASTGRGLRHARAGVSVRRSAKRHRDPVAGQ